MQKLVLKNQVEPIRLGSYPYTYVRTVVMRALLLKKEDYRKMLKMSFSEIAKFLQDSNYRKEINALATQLSGADLIELALNRNLAEPFKKLARISSQELALLVREYIKRKDIEDIKTILRGKFTGTNEKIIVNSITAAGTLSYDFLMSLLKKDSVEGVLKDNKIVEFNLFKGALKDLNEKRNLVGIENVFDRQYYGNLIEFSKALPKEGALFRNFLLKEVEILNLLTGDKAKDSKIIGLMTIGSLDELQKALEKTEYKDIVAKGLEEFKKTGSLILVEAELYKHLLKQSVLFMHQHPLSIDVILGYMFAKDIEVRNLRIIVKGKQLGLKEEFIESQLVY